MTRIVDTYYGGSKDDRKPKPVDGKNAEDAGERELGSQEVCQPTPEPTEGTAVDENAGDGDTSYVEPTPGCDVGSPSEVSTADVGPTQEDVPGDASPESTGQCQPSDGTDNNSSDENQNADGGNGKDPESDRDVG